MASGMLFAEGFDWRVDGGYLPSGWTGGYANTISASYRNGPTGKGMRNYDTSHLYFTTAATDHVVLHYMVKPSSHNGQYALCSFLCNSTSTYQLSVDRMSDGSIAVYRPTGPVELGRTAAGLMPISGAWMGLEIRVKFDNSAGEVEIRIDGVQQLLLTSVDTQDTAYADCTGVMFKMDVGNETSVDDIVFRDYSVNPTMTGNYIVRSLMPNGNGNSSQFTGSDADSTDNYLLVDEIPHDSDTTYVESSTIGHKDMYAITNTGFSAATILAVQVHTIARKTDGVTRQIETVIRHSTNETNGATQTLGSSYDTRKDVFDDVPGGTGWTLAQVEALEVGQTVIA